MFGLGTMVVNFKEGATYIIAKQPHKVKFVTFDTDICFLVTVEGRDEPFMLYPYDRYNRVKTAK